MFVVDVSAVLQKLEPTIDGDILVVDSDTRTIAADSLILGVAGDENANRVYFLCPKVVSNDIDLTTLYIFINYINANNEPGQYLVEDVQIIEQDYILFSWETSANVTVKNGKVKFQICAKKTVDDETNHWNTTYSKGKVLKGLETTNDLVQQNVDVIDQILARLTGVEEETATITNDHNELQNVPTKLSQFENDLNLDIPTKLSDLEIDMEVGGASSWNDLEDKPFSKEFSEEGNVLIDNNCKVYAQGQAQYIVTPTFKLKENYKYSLTINNESYENLLCKHVIVTEVVGEGEELPVDICYLGNMSIVGLGDDYNTEETYVLYSSHGEYNGELMENVYFATTNLGSESKVSISLIEHALIDKFEGVIDYSNVLNQPKQTSSWNDLEDKPFEDTRAEIEMANSTYTFNTTDGYEVSISENITFDENLGTLITAGQTIKVIIDDVTYVSTVKQTSMGYTITYAGNANMLFEALDSSDEPYAIIFQSSGVCGMSTTLEGSEHHIIISIVDGSLKQLDPKFIPEHPHSWNDLTDKPFYETTTWTELDSGTYTSMEMRGVNLVMPNNMATMDKSIVEGQNIRVSWNEQVYEFKVESVEISANYSGETQSSKFIYFGNFQLYIDMLVANGATIESCSKDISGTDVPFTYQAGAYMSTEPVENIEVITYLGETEVKQIDPKFVKMSYNDLEDKPFEKVEEVVNILNEPNIALTPLDENTSFAELEASYLDLVENKSYKITINNEIYYNNFKCVDIAGTQLSILGNGRLYATIAGATLEEFEKFLSDMGAEGIDISIFDDTGDPFMFVWAEGQSFFILSESLETCSIAIELEDNVLDIHEDYLELLQTDWENDNKLSLGYIKNKPFYISDETYDVVVQEEAEFNLSTNYGEVNISKQEFPNIYSTNYNTFELPFVIVRGCVYDVIWDGVKYENLIAYDGYGGPCLGFDYSDLFKNNADIIKYPFSINPGNIINLTPPGTHTLKVIKKENKIITLPEKFLPNTKKYQGDWEEKHHYNLGYIKNKPFYDTRAESVLDVITWDGQFEYSEGITLNSFGMKYVKVSDITPRIECVLGKKYHEISHGETVIDESMIRDNGSYYEIAQGYNPKAMIVLEDCIVEGVECSKGTYFKHQGSANYTTSLEYMTDPGELKQLDEKFIPDTIARKTDLDNLGSSGESDVMVVKYVPDHYGDAAELSNTFDEISEAYNSGKVVVAMQSGNNSQAGDIFILSNATDDMLWFSSVVVTNTTLDDVGLTGQNAIAGQIRGITLDKTNTLSRVGVGNGGLMFFGIESTLAIIQQMLIAPLQQQLDSLINGEEVEF